MLYSHHDILFPGERMLLSGTCKCSKTKNWKPDCFYSFMQVNSGWICVKPKSICETFRSLTNYNEHLMAPTEFFGSSRYTHNAHFVTIYSRLSVLNLMCCLDHCSNVFLPYLNGSWFYLQKCFMCMPIFGEAATYTVRYATQVTKTHLNNYACRSSPLIMHCAEQLFTITFIQILYRKKLYMPTVIFFTDYQQ